MSVLNPVRTQQVKWASDIQRDAFTWGPSPMCMSGGWGSGKTWCGCMKALWLSDTFPKNRGVIARRVQKELRATTMSTFFKVCHPSAYSQRFGGRRNDSEGYLKLARSQSEILFLHLESAEASTIIKGLEINWFLIDQAEENPEQMEEIFDNLCGRLGRWDPAVVPQWMLDAERAAGREWTWTNPESGRPMPPPYAMLAVNPDVETHWIYRRFHPESEEHADYRDKHGYTMFHMPSETNQFLSQTNRDYLHAHDQAFIRRNVLGLWGLPEGAIHFVDKRSLVPGSPELLAYFRESCTLHRTMDHGDSAPTCVLWWAVDRNGNVFCFREYYLPNALISRHRQNVYDLSEFEKYDFNLADPSIFNQTMQSVKKGHFSVADEYSDVVEQAAHTALFWQPADNNELGTRNRINEYLQVDEHRLHPITHEYGSPRLFFVTPAPHYPQGVVHALRQVRSQRRVKIGTELGKPIFSDERDDAVPDHGYDCVRYFIASRPPIAVGPTPKAAPGTFYHAQQRLAQQQRRQMGMR